MRYQTRVLLASLVVASVVALHADIVNVTTGAKLEGVVLRENETSVVLRLKYGTTTIPRKMVVSIERVAQQSAADTDSRLAAWDWCIESMVGRSWADQMRQIPATVIDKGILQRVPYMSHRSGDYEFNIYGDPDSPAGLEIGVYKDLLKSDAAKRECRDFLSRLLGNKEDQAILASLDLSKDKKERDGLTFEVTPETAEDSYGGWWISVYDVKALEAQRVPEKEMAEITVTKEEIEGEDAASAIPEKKEPPGSAKEAPPAAASAGPAIKNEEDAYRWHAPDLPLARQPAQRPTVASWYIRGYHRRQGTYASSWRRGGGRK